MSTYLEIVNRVGENLRYEPLTSAGFAAPRAPYGALKRFVNEAKDAVIARIGSGLFEREFAFETMRAVTGEEEGNTITALGGSTLLAVPGTLFTSAMIGAKIVLPDLEFNQTAHPAGAGLTDPTGHRIMEPLVAAAATVDVDFGNDPTGQTNWTIYKDEYALDSSARRVLSAWTSRGPLDLCFVDSVSELDRWFPGLVTISAPTMLAIARDTDGIWQARLYPAPEEREIIRYRAKCRLEDLEDADDEWPIEPELEGIIVDDATRKACASPIRNDPDLANLYNQDVSRRAAEWKAENDPVDPQRRIRRRAPGESSWGNRRSWPQIPEDP